LLTSLYPRYLKYKLYAVYLSHNVSEHSARMIAMQTATDNADSLLTDLNVYYNKTRQQSITNELLDIMGGSGR
jgi:ATP synthase F1 subcomplex gamma subunit